MNALPDILAQALAPVTPPNSYPKRSYDRVVAELIEAQRTLYRLLTVEVELHDGPTNSPDARVTYVTVPQDIAERCLLRLISSYRSEYEEMCEADYRAQLGRDE